MAGTGVHNLKSKSDFDAALADSSLMIIDCMATWCAPCKMIAPEIVKLSNTYPGARFYKLDVDEVPDVAGDLGVTAMPTFIVFKGGERVGEVVGANLPSVKAVVVEHLDEGAGAKVE